MPVMKGSFDSGSRPAITGSAKYGPNLIRDGGRARPGRRVRGRSASTAHGLPHRRREDRRRRATPARDERAPLLVEHRGHEVGEGGGLHVAVLPQLVQVVPELEPVVQRLHVRAEAREADEEVIVDLEHFPVCGPCAERSECGAVASVPDRGVASCHASRENPPARRGSARRAGQPRRLPRSPRARATRAARMSTQAEAQHGRPPRVRGGRGPRPAHLKSVACVVCCRPKRRSLAIATQFFPVIAITAAPLYARIDIPPAPLPSLPHAPLPSRSSSLPGPARN